MNEVTISVPFKDELLLERNVYNTGASRTDLEALAQTLQNLLIIEPGTYPNQPELGVGIQNYEFEFLDDITLNELKSNIDKQITKFLPNNFYVEFDVSTVTNELNKQVLVITFNVTADATLKQTSEITMLFANNKDTNKIISKIII
jgi:phage baseplate assembly protein W